MLQNHSFPVPGWVPGPPSNGQLRPTYDILYPGVLVCHRWEVAETRDICISQQKMGGGGRHDRKSDARETAIALCAIGIKRKVNTNDGIGSPTTVLVTACAITSVIVLAESHVNTLFFSFIDRSER
eukprot:COSAG02_NODE_9738_length_2126_cov_15.154909_1_plen_126_part_00